MTFADTLSKHLRAIQERDLQALRETLPAERLVLIMGDGRLVTSVAEFVELHKSWFEQSSWSLEMQLVDQRETPDLGVAVLRLEYRDQSPSEGSIHQLSHLTLMFARQDGKWVMVHDQNTPLKNPA